MGMKSSVILNLNPAPTLSWKTVPGNLWVDGDTVNPDHNTTIFMRCEDSEIITVNLPAITPASAGKKIEIINMIVSPKAFPGNVTLIPDPNDFMESILAGDFPAGFLPDSNLNKCHFWLVSDGVDRWSLYYPDAGLAHLTPA